MFRLKIYKDRIDVNISIRVGKKKKSAF